MSIVNHFRLTSLELNGYKTFASRTRFEFAGNITAIVGPNGSGKSNIADSIRWVLGEQAYSVLRGRKTEDMIFSGSEKKAKAGMASVTVTFDNHDGWLPIDFSEVSITRRAYRDGQNEYLINQQKVRLRDVNELLSQSSLAERTYTVIGQGLVDSALTLNSDERRRLFEEAAGIGLYRNRKDQSLKRLLETRRNLDRVADILAELKPRLRGLERQARRAQEFSGLRTDLRENLRTWYGYQWHRAQDKWLALRAAAESREENLGLGRQKQSELSNELGQLRNKTQELRIQLNTWHRRLAELHAGREKSGRELAISTERQRALADQRQALSDESQRLQTEKKSTQSRLDESAGEKSRIENEIAESQKKLEEARKILNAILAEEDENAANNRQAIEAHSDLRAQLLTLATQREEFGLRQERDRREISDLETALIELESNSTDLASEEISIQSELSNKEKELQSQEEELEEAEREQSRLQSNSIELEDQLAALFRQQAKLNSEFVALSSSQAASEGFARGAQALLAAAKQKRLSVSSATLGSSLKLPRELENAIAAALGDYLEAVLLAKRAQVDSALGLLEKEDHSLALLPLDLDPPVRKDAAPKGEGILGIAADLIEAPKELQSAVNLLLGQVLVVKDRATAMKISKRPDNPFRVVTLRGEVFHPSGLIEVRSSKMAAPLARPRQLEDLTGELKKSESDVQQLQSSIEKNAVAAALVEKSLLELRQTIESSSVQRENINRRRQTLAMQKEQSNRQQEWFKSQQRNAERNLLALDEQLKKLDSDEQNLNAALLDARTKVDQIELPAELPLDEHRAQLAHWEMRLAVSQRALQESNRRELEFQQLIDKAQQQIDSTLNRTQELDELETTLIQESAHLNTSEDDAGGEIASIQSSIGPAEEELNQAENELRSSQDAERKALTQLSVAERNHTQAQISLARQQESLSTLRSRIEDDFGLVAFDYDDAVTGPTPLPLGDLVERLPVLDSIEPDLEHRLKEQRAQLRRLGSINPEAQHEYESVKARFEDMLEQIADLDTAQENLKEVIAELDLLMDREFRSTFDTVAAEFRTIFSRLFEGGNARLILTEESDLTNTGIDIEARLPGKRSQRLALLSGGERSLTATALVFALLKASPTPFCVMDEVDAMLDEANVGRFTDLLRELSEDTQFVLITHNRNTVQVADVIYGITMGRDTASQVISLKLDEVDHRYSD